MKMTSQKNEEFVIVEVTLHKEGSLAVRHIPFHIIKEKNKEFWERVLFCLEGLVDEIKSYLEQNEDKGDNRP